MSSVSVPGAGSGCSLDGGWCVGQATGVVVGGWDILIRVSVVIACTTA
mgnify:CR=1 FL=1